jgi:hypothetical protein
VQIETSGGSSDTGTKELAAIPIGVRLISAARAITEEGKRPNAARREVAEGRPKGSGRRPPEGKWRLAVCPGRARRTVWSFANNAECFTHSPRPRRHGPLARPGVPEFAEMRPAGALPAKHNFSEVVQNYPSGPQ